MWRITDFVDYASIPDEHKEAVAFCTAHNLANRKDNGAFDSGGSVTYGEFCRLICVTESLGHDPFLTHTNGGLGKCEVNHWASAYIQTCHVQNIYKKDGDKFHPDQSVIYGDVYDMLSATYHFITDDYWYPEYGQKFDAQVTRSGIAFELFKLCQGIGVFLLREKDPYVIPSDDDLRKYFFFITSLPADYSHISYIFNFASQMGYTEQDIPLEAVYQLLKYKEDNLVKYGPEKSIYHFTSLNTLEHLTAPGARFRLSNAEFLNDPSEGQILMKYIPKCLKEMDKDRISPNLISWLLDINSKDGNRSFRPNNTYIASFLSTDLTSPPDSLPMWNTYADNGKGCVFKLSIYSETYLNKYPLYKIHYTPKEAQEFLDGYIIVLNNLWEKITLKNGKSADLFRDIAYDILVRCSYLFKHKSYDYEHEVRAITFCSPKDAKREDSPRKGELFARTYCEVPFHIDHVIFGPAVPDPKRLAVGLAAMGLDCTFEKSDIPFTIV